MANKYWLGDPGTQCQICNGEFGNTFIDGATRFGPWAIMCLRCSVLHGTGLGQGRGQKYQKQPDGKWLKVGG